MILADARHLPIASGVVQCCVTSPPYFHLRDYGTPTTTWADGWIGELGQEPTPEMYVGHLLEIFREVHRVLRADGVLWLNIADSYAGSWGAQSRGGPPSKRSTLEGNGHRGGGPKLKSLSAVQIAAHPKGTRTGSIPAGADYRAKDLYGIPWMLAFALRSIGWRLRSDIVWSKPNCMPESVTDRPTRSHEYVFLLTKSPRYYYDAEAIKNPPAASTLRELEQEYDRPGLKDFSAAGVQDASAVKSRIVKRMREKQRGHGRRHDGFNDRWDQMTGAEQRALGSNARSVWTISPQPFRGAHFATMPEELAARCILAGSRPGDLVFDPFLGSGTVTRQAISLGRRAVGCDLQPKYLPLQRERNTVTRGLPLEIDEAAS